MPRNLYNGKSDDGLQIIYTGSDGVELPNRKKIRLVRYDYSSCGKYFVTICTHNRECLLGEIVGHGLCPCRISDIGKIAEQEIENIQNRFENIVIDKYVIMPNHVHLILVINPRQGQSPCPTIGDIIGTMKSISTKRANKQDNIFG